MSQESNSRRIETLNVLSPYLQKYQRILMLQKELVGVKKQMLIIFMMLNIIQGKVRSHRSRYHEQNAIYCHFQRAVEAQRQEYIKLSRGMCDGVYCRWFTKGFTIWFNSIFLGSVIGGVRVWGWLHCGFDNYLN